MDTNTRHPIGIMADSLRLPFAESLQKCRQLGADGVQLYAVSGEMAPEAQTPAGIAEKRRILADNGLAVSALCGDLGGHGSVWLRRTRKRSRAQSVSSIWRFLSTAAW